MTSGIVAAAAATRTRDGFQRGPAAAGWPTDRLTDWPVGRQSETVVRPAATCEWVTGLR